MKLTTLSLTLLIPALSLCVEVGGPTGNDMSNPEPPSEYRTAVLNLIATTSAGFQNFVEEAKKRHSAIVTALSGDNMSLRRGGAEGGIHNLNAFVPMPDVPRFDEAQKKIYSDVQRTIGGEHLTNIMHVPPIVRQLEDVGISARDADADASFLVKDGERGYGALLEGVDFWLKQCGELQDMMMAPSFDATEDQLRDNSERLDWLNDEKAWIENSAPVWEDAAAGVLRLPAVVAKWYPSPDPHGAKLPIDVDRLIESLAGGKNRGKTNKQWKRYVSKIRERLAQNYNSVRREWLDRNDPDLSDVQNGLNRASNARFVYTALLTKISDRLVELIKDGFMGKLDDAMLDSEGLGRFYFPGLNVKPKLKGGRGDINRILGSDSSRSVNEAILKALEGTREKNSAKVGKKASMEHARSIKDKKGDSDREVVFDGMDGAK